MEITLRLELPREEVSVPVVRRLLSRSLDTLGVEPDVTGDLQLALTEACTNVLEHAEDGDEYEIVISLNDGACVLEVLDRGEGFDGNALGRADAGAGAEGGRGIQLMRGLMDDVQFLRRDDANVVRMSKVLRWREDALLTPT